MLEIAQSFAQDENPKGYGRPWDQSIRTRNKKCQKVKLEAPYIVYKEDLPVLWEDGGPYHPSNREVEQLLVPRTRLKMYSNG